MTVITYEAVSNIRINGNSYTVTIPKQLAELMQLTSNDEIIWTVEDMNGNYTLLIELKRG